MRVRAFFIVYAGMTLVITSIDNIADVRQIHVGNASQVESHALVSWKNEQRVFTSVSRNMSVTAAE